MTSYVADGDQGFLVLWQGIIDRTTGRVFGRFVDLSGESTGGQFQVSHGHGTVQVAPAVAARPDGGYLAVGRDWVGVHFGISAIELDAAGQPQGAPVRLNSRGLQKNGRTSPLQESTVPSFPPCLGGWHQLLRARADGILGFEEPKR